MTTEARAAFRTGAVHRWIGTVNALPGGAVALPMDQRHQPDIDGQPNLYFVGDYLYDTTLNGALDAADYVADRIHEALEMARSASKADTAQ
jgi:hypothetical protein